MHRKKHIYVCFLFALMGIIYSTQVLAEVRVITEWSKTYGSTLNDHGSNIIQTGDGGYLWTGFLGSPDTSSEDACLTKVDSSGNLEWQKTYGGSGSDKGVFLIPAEEGGYLMCGYTQSYGSGGYDAWLVRVNMKGDTIWTKTFGGVYNDFIFSGIEAPAGGYILAGALRQKDFWVIRIDSLGNVLWEKVMGGPLEDQARSIKRTSDNNYIIAGYVDFSISSDRGDLLLVKMDDAGEILWQNTYGGTGRETGSSVIQTDDMGFMVSGYSTSFGNGDLDLWLLKTDNAGNQLWYKIFGGMANDYGHMIEKSSDTAYLITGYTESSGAGGRDLWVMKIDNAGNVIWTSVMGGPQDDIGQCVRQTRDGGCIVIGQTTSYGQGSGDAWLIKYAREIFFKADFSADTTFGEPPLTVKFVDHSYVANTAEISTWQWDLNDDGQMDSEAHSAEWTYNEPGAYSVTLKVSNGQYTDSCLKKNFIVVLSEHPEIINIKDVPNDQGRWVSIKFARSIYDTDSLVLPKTSAAELYTIEQHDGAGWVAAANTIAYGKDFYTVLVPTLYDSSFYTNGMTTFRVIAGMEEGNFVSRVDSGYSIDNTAPVQPGGLKAYFVSDTGIDLIWNPNPEKDINAYRIFKGLDGSPMAMLQEISATSFRDADVQPGVKYAYSVTAVDHAGNTSPMSQTVEILISGIEQRSDVPAKYYLSQNYPNPFNPETVIRFGILKSGPVRLTVYDILGNKIIDLVNNRLEAGQYETRWYGVNQNSSAVSSGVYYYRIISGEFMETRKMYLLR